jgi:uncharacterized protein (UPF0218 family)
MDVAIERGGSVPGDVTLELPEEMRDELKVPLGPIVQGEELLDRLPDKTTVCTVGDMTTETVHRIGITIKMAVVDYQTKREPDARWAESLASVGERTVEVDNPAATITSDLYNLVLEAWTFPLSTKILVRGEEDMASLPAILHAPGGATVIYGIPDTGLCLVQVDERARTVVSDVLARMRVRRSTSSPQGGRKDGT